MRRTHATSLAACLAATAMIGVVALRPTSARAAAPGADALAAIKADNARVQSITKRKPKPGTPEAARQEEALKTLAVQALDLPTMAKAALGKHWATLAPAQQKTFSDTFTELVKNNYVNQIRASSGYTITYGAVEPKGGDVAVDTTIRVKRNGHTDESDVKYTLRKVAGSWVIEDIVTDDESMIEDYRSEFGKVIAEKGFDALEKKLEAKVAKLRAQQ